MVLASKVINPTGAIREFEKPEVCEAIKVANANKWTVGLTPIEWDEREARLKKEYEENTKVPGPGEAQTEDKSSSVPHAGLVYDQNFEVERLRQENKDLLKVVEKMKEGNPALKEAASQFNDALLDEQAKKIAELTKDKTNLEDQITILNACKEHNENFAKREIKRLGKDIARLNKVINKKNLKIEELRKESSEHLRGRVKMFGETVDLSQELCDKNEELRLTKIREKNLTEVCQKYMKENEELKKELADKVVDKIDAQALKSAESALAYKEKVIAEKDEVIADLGKELEATKNELEEKNYLIDMLRCGSREYCEYGIAAEKMIQKMAKVIVEERAIDSEDFEEYRRLANGYRFNPQLPELSEEEEKKLSSAKDTHPTEDNPEEVEMDEILERVRKALEEGHTVSIDYDKAEEGADQSATIVQCDNGITLSKEEAEIIERCTKNGMELHYSEKDGFTYTNVFDKEMPIRCLLGMFHVFTDEEIENMKKVSYGSKQ